MTAMKPDEYRAAIKTLGLTQNGAGEFFGVNPVTGRRWAKSGPPTPVAKMLRLMLAMKLTPAQVDAALSEAA